KVQLAPYFLLTNRQVLAVVNVGEDELDRIPAVEEQGRAEVTSAGDNVEVIGMCVQLEAEAATIEDPAERAEMLEGFGLGEGALFRMVRSAYHLLGLRTFLTTGYKEARAWTFYDGSTAPQCAGRIHTDFQRGFIRAEVIKWDELLGIGSWTKAKEVGKLRVEGKDYVAQDGDVMEFRFNVRIRGNDRTRRCGRFALATDLACITRERACCGKRWLSNCLLPR